SWPWLISAAEITGRPKGSRSRPTARCSSRMKAPAGTERSRCTADTEPEREHLRALALGPGPLRYDSGNREPHPPVVREVQAHEAGRVPLEQRPLDLPHQAGMPQVPGAAHELIAGVGDPGPAAANHLEIVVVTRGDR